MAKSVNAVQLDFWYGNTLSEITHVSCSFSDCDCMYRGNMFINGKCVGDFASYDSVAIEKFFPGIWD